ncbi:hypothetical protein AB0I22_35585 [Streptomyces sp. NPDC050610]|uniref:hypothetical protein n=1 Tax=Streptomyces sp. NPDC050610 TaxID=3157097 RepID=UPI0034333EE3
MNLTDLHRRPPADVLAIGTPYPLVITGGSVVGEQVAGFAGVLPGDGGGLGDGVAEQVVQGVGAVGQFLSGRLMLAGWAWMWALNRLQARAVGLGWAMTSDQWVARRPKASRRADVVWPAPR